VRRRTDAPNRGQIIETRIAEIKSRVRTHTDFMIPTDYEGPAETSADATTTFRTLVRVWAGHQNAKSVLTVAGDPAAGANGRVAEQEQHHR
jgi:hypothetical protein